jgi:hypothetical protein
VIVYQVQTTDPLGNAQNMVPPLNLLTKTGLTAGQSYAVVNGVMVQVNSAVAGGFSITVTNNGSGIVPDGVNEPEATASEKITAAGFTPKFKFPETPAAAAGGGGENINIYVGSQSPVGGATAPLGTVVTLTMEVTIVR